MVMRLFFQFISWSLYALRMVRLCPSIGLLVPVPWAFAAHRVGISSPYVGQPLPMLWAMSARILGLFLGNIL